MISIHNLLIELELGMQSILQYNGQKFKITAKENNPSQRAT